MPQAAAASARDDPSSTWAIAKIRQATRPSWLREATRRSFSADSSSRVTSICRPMMSSVARCRAATENLTCRQMGTSKSHESQDFRRLVLDARLGLLPERFHFVQGGVSGFATGFGQAPLDVAKAAFELVVGGAQCRLGIDLAVACEVGHGEQNIAQFVGQARLIDVARRQLGSEFAQFLLDLIDDRTGLLPIKTYSCRPLLDLFGPQERGQGACHPVQGTGRLGARPFGRSFGGFAGL